MKFLLFLGSLTASFPPYDLKKRSYYGFKTPYTLYVYIFNFLIYTHAIYSFYNRIYLLYASLKLIFVIADVVKLFFLYSSLFFLMLNCSKKTFQDLHKLGHPRSSRRNCLKNFTVLTYVLFIIFFDWYSWGRHLNIYVKIYMIENFVYFQMCINLLIMVNVIDSVKVCFRNLLVDLKNVGSKEKRTLWNVIKVQNSHGLLCDVINALNKMYGPSIFCPAASVLMGLLSTVDGVCRFFLNSEIDWFVVITTIFWILCYVVNFF